MKLFLIDGHALIFKMYYAFLGRPMINSKGADTSIIFGFTKYLLELIEKEAPSHLAVAFDPPGGTFRNVMFPAYKANRGETPQLVIDALEPLTAICQAIGIPVVTIPGFEADDVIGSMAKQFAAEGADVYMVTPDKDYGQLVEEHIFQFRPGKGGDNEILGSAEICGKWGISSPLQVIDILTLCGDTADNVPGVNGVGPVGAAKLLNRYGDVENIYSHLEELTPKMREKFESAREHIRLSKELVTIKTDIRTGLSLDEMALSISLTGEMDSLIKEYELFSLKRHFKQNAAAPSGAFIPPVKAEEKPAAEILFSPSEIEISSLPAIGHPAKLSLRTDGESLHLSDGRKCAVCSIREASSLLEDSSVTKYGYNLKSIMNSLSESGITLEGKLMDAQILHYLIDPEKPHDIDLLLKEYLGILPRESEEESSVEIGGLFDNSADSADISLETAALIPLCDKLYNILQESASGDLYDKIEEPLIGVLSRMETTGVRIDPSALRSFADSLRVAAAGREKEIRDIAGSPNLNVSSPKQIGEVIFEKLKLAPGAKKPGKGSWPTDETTLMELSDKSPIIEAILDYRGLKKLLSTYIEPIPGYISPVDGRVHTTFNQALTATGRLSSSNPNLQNIPVRTAQGREIRKAFVPQKEDWVIMSADYSQIELRLMAHFCSDAHLIDAFRQGIDVHSVTASKIFGVKLEEVTSDQRRVAKTANFGIMYGISAFGLSQRLGCSRSEAKQIIEDYFASFPSIRGFIDSTLSRARSDGYVETLFGRRRYLPDLTAHNAQIRALAERNAVNAPIQGTAADIIKLAMTGVDRRLRREKMESRMILQIHDELLLEVPQSEIQASKRILTDEMEGVIKLSVPLTVECNYGKTWLEAH